MTLWAHCIPFTTSSGQASTNTATRKLLKMPCGIIVNFYPKFATIERYFYDTNNREILTSDGNPFQRRQMGTGELARAPKASCFK